MLASLSIGFNNTNVEQEWALLEPVKATDFAQSLSYS